MKSSATDRSRERSIQNPNRLSRGRLALEMLKAMLLVAKTPWILRLAGTMDMPWSTASAGLPIETCSPLTRTAPESAPAMPYSARITSPAPHPIRPYSATISPGRTANETSTNLPVRRRCSTDRAGSAAVGVRSIGAVSSTWPTISSATSRTENSDVGRLATTAPSRSTVTRSVICASSSRR